MRTGRELVELVVEVLAAHGVRRIFGVPGGGPNLDLVGAAQAVGIDFVLAHGETAAALMAAAHGGCTGTVGVAVVTRGPGLASAVNGLAAATLDRLPLLLLSDAVPAADAERVAHQRIDQVRLTSAVTRFSGVLGERRPDDALRAALAVAAGPPAGAVHLDVDAGLPGGSPAAVPSGAGSAGPMDVNREAATRIAAGCRRPVVLVGPLAGDADRLRTVLADAGVPALTSYQAKGWLAHDDPGHAGLFTNTAAERPLLAEADLVVGVGLDPVELMPGRWQYSAPVVLLHPCPVDGRYFGDPLVLTGASGEPVELLAELLAATAADWPAGTGAVHRERAVADLETSADGLSPHDVVRAVAATAGDAVVTVDAGAHMLVVMPLWPATGPRDVLISNGLGTMGFALPAAIGAALGRPERRVVCFTGDGGLGMVLAELETLARLGPPVSVVVFNDARLSLIEIKQGPGQGGRAAVGYGLTDFAGVARASGLSAVVARTADQVSEALAGVPAATDGPLLVDARVDPSVYPHVIRATRG